MAVRHPYVRPAGGWWRGNAYLMRYLGREFTSIAVAAYAMVLLVGLVRLVQGEPAWAGWLEALRSPLSIVFHAVLLVAFIVHTWTWFAIMPKTMPPLHLRGKRVPDCAITGLGLAAAAFAWILVIVVAGAGL
jgi:fumarate reductase subunit C